MNACTYMLAFKIATTRLKGGPPQRKDPAKYKNNKNWKNTKIQKHDKLQIQYVSVDTTTNHFQ